MKIVNVPISQFQRARRSRGGRRRSAETIQLIEAIQSLKSGTARAVVPDRGQDLAKVRAKLMYTAKLAGVRLRVVVADNRLLFTRRPGRPRARS